MPDLAPFVLCPVNPADYRSFGSVIFPLIALAAAVKGDARIV